MSFWLTALAMALVAWLPKMISWAWVNSPQGQTWRNRCYGTTRWSLFAPNWAKRITKKEK